MQHPTTPRLQCPLVVQGDSGKSGLQAPGMLDAMVQLAHAAFGQTMSGAVSPSFCSKR